MTPTDRHGDTHPAFDEESFRDALAEFGALEAAYGGYREFQVRRIPKA